MKVTKIMLIFVLKLCKKSQILSFGSLVSVIAKVMACTVLLPSASSRMSYTSRIPIMAMHPYYGYALLDRGLPLSMRLRVRRGLHLLLRIANHLQPSTIVLPRDAWWEKRYLKCGCKNANIQCGWQEGEVSMCLLREPCDEALEHLGEHSVLLLDNLHLHRDWFKSIPSVVSFDLYDFGIAFFDKQYNKQYYKVNF